MTGFWTGFRAARLTIWATSPLASAAAVLSRTHRRRSCLQSWSVKLAKMEWRGEMTRRLQDLQDLQAKDYDRRYLHPSWRLYKISNPALGKWKEDTPHKFRTRTGRVRLRLSILHWAKGSGLRIPSLSVRISWNLVERLWTSLDRMPLEGQIKHLSLVGLCCLVDCSWSE